MLPLVFAGGLLAAGIVFTAGLAVGRRAPGATAAQSSRSGAAAVPANAAQQVHFTIDAPGAREVAVVGDFNGWNRHNATRSHWSARALGGRRHAAPGPAHLRLRCRSHSVDCEPIGTPCAGRRIWNTQLGHSRGLPIVTPRRSIGVFALALVCAENGTAQSSRDQLDRQSAAQITQIIADADSARLPVALLRAKVAEGLSKGASAELIVAAVRVYATMLHTARLAFDGDTNSTNLDAGASALRVGARPDLLLRVHALRASSGVAMPLVLFVDFVKRGIPPDSVSSGLLAVLAAGGSDAQLVSLQRQVARQTADGADALTTFRAALRTQSGLGTDLKPLPPRPPVLTGERTQSAHTDTTVSTPMALREGGRVSRRSSRRYSTAGSGAISDKQRRVAVCRARYGLRFWRRRCTTPFVLALAERRAGIRRLRHGGSQRFPRGNPQLAPGDGPAPTSGWGR